MKQLFANNAKTALTSALGPSGLVLDVADGSKFPIPAANEFFLVTLELGSQIEIVRATSRMGNTITLSDRAVEGTTSYSFSIGSRAESRVTKGTLENLYNTFSEIASVNDVVSPNNSVNSGYICGTLDPTGTPVVLIKNSGTTWKFLNYSLLQTAVVSSANVNSLVSTGLLPSVISAGKYLVEFTSGPLSGYIREIATANSTNLTWTTVLPSIPTAGTTFEVYEATSTAIAGASIPDATTTVKGKVELATSVETITGIDTDRAVTPAGLLAALAAYGGGSSSPGSIPAYFYTSTGGETLITLPWSYTIGNNTLMVFKRGILQRITTHYTETSTNSLTLSTALIAGDNLTVMSLATSGVSGGGGGTGNSISAHTVTATGGETVISLPWSYTVGTNTLMVFRNGIMEYLTTHYAETSSTSLTLSTALVAGDILKVLAVVTVSSSGYLPLIGGTMAGSLILAADGAAPLEAVTKQQLDAVAAGAGTGGLGSGQTWQNFTGPARTRNTVFQNNTGGPILVSIWVSVNTGDYVLVGPVNPPTLYAAQETNGYAAHGTTLQAVVPDGWYYSCAALSIMRWMELRA